MKAKEGKCKAFASQNATHSFTYYWLRHADWRNNLPSSPHCRKGDLIHRFRCLSSRLVYPGTEREELLFVKHVFFFSPNFFISVALWNSLSFSFLFLPLGFHRACYCTCPGANILVDNKGCIKLADFGAAKKVVELATINGTKSIKGSHIGSLLKLFYRHDIQWNQI